MKSTKPSSRTGPVSVEFLQAQWTRVAHRYFDDRLPPIIIEWSFRLTASTGMFISQVGPRSQHVSQEERHGAARRIRLSAPLLQDQPESEIIRTLAHEMIHQWQYDVKKRYPNHGPDFYDVMARMNLDGLGITVRHTLDHEVEKLSKYLWRCLACGTSYRRQRRTISSRRHRCGKCYGRLEEVLLNVSIEEQERSGESECFSSSLRKDPLRKFRTSDEVKPQQLAFDF
ncbi:SprT-like domain-containing protein [Nitrospira sp. M1]